MGNGIRIHAAGLDFEAQLEDSPTARAIQGVLPFQGVLSVWGGEIYFPIPVDVPLEPGARETLEVGEIAYWPTGRMFCIFFGPTPVSTGSAPQAMAPVTPIGRIQGDPTRLQSLQDGDILYLVPGNETTAG